MMYIIAWAVALFFALNIGASGTAASMGAAYGAGALRKRWAALSFVAGAVFLGAFLGGGSVVKTISTGILPGSVMTTEITVIILAAACITLFLANLLRVPLSTSEVTVGSLVGVGVAFHSLYLGKILFLVIVWLVLPFLAYTISFTIGKFVPRLEHRWRTIRHPRRLKMTLTILLIGSGCYEAFSAGMNNVANAVGPLVGAGMISTHSGLLWGAVLVSLGALTLGGRVLETNAKKITDLSLLQGSTVSLTTGTLVIIASVFGLPVPLTQATTMSILGVGSAKHGMGLWKMGIVKRVLLVWITSPLSSLVVSYVLVKLVVSGDLYSVVAILCAFVMAAGYLSFARHDKKPRASAAVEQLPSRQVKFDASPVHPKDGHTAQDDLGDVAEPTR